MKPTFQILVESDLTEIANSFVDLGWVKPRLQYETYLREQAAGYRTVIVCRNGIDKKFAGYVTLVWDSLYPSFQNLNIPEIVDLVVLPEFRNRGLGALLMAGAENVARARGHEEIGLGVGLLADYGPAQRLYVRLGYLPDGRGLYSGNRPAQQDEMIRAGDDLVLYLSKPLRDCVSAKL